MADLHVDEKDFIPPYLTRLKAPILGVNLTAKKISSEKTQYTYTIEWEEEKEPSPRVGAGSDVNVKKQSENAIAEIMTLAQRTDGQWSVPRTYHMVSTRAMVFLRASDGSVVKQEIWTESEASTLLKDVVKSLLDELPYRNSKEAVYFCPVAKNSPLVQLTKKDMETKQMRQMELHHGKLCLVIDLAGVFEVFNKF